ncbi:MAG: preprotein translocase subunit SecY [archaeon]|jgi:preprotein translocase subunit SecY|nr:preprotein translocase subunit SecY [archaeon]MDD2477595.1 preprotein translocase subunit SecY [Candidatus ainarchaeum sp.]MDD3084310.1 preprotein translocase subunit SecY [Candidatus ainarchaeum sp.]MDD4221051.1 preprotein translocase subunit SecY [Candidatus ainarchaeum sp.]MDD4662523.1 preprotein translocase subunit SecY [Candidatus ainarchaeum sp.]
MSFYSIAQKILPSVKDPSKVPVLKKKLIWTGIVLAVFFILGTVKLIGISPTALVNLEYYQMIMASQLGTLISLGIGPIVLSSIILQLLVGVKVINLNFSNPEDRAKFSILQKLFAVVLSIVEAVVAVSVGMLVPLPGMALFIVIQVALGSILLLYLDEVVSKYGIGSGVGLFIAAGVSQSIIWRLFALPSATLGTKGLLFVAFDSITTGAISQLISSFIIPLLVTFAVFLIVVYVEGMHVNIPLTVGRSGIGAKYPVKLLYVSNMPVILAATLFANVALFVNLAKNTFLENIMFKIAAVLTPQYGLLESTILGGATWGMWGSALIYMVIFVVTCVLFGKFWVQVGGQDSASVAKQLQSSGMSIPGFRRDQRVLTTVLKRYIPTITILGSIFVSLLAFFSDLTGAIGSGIGILLTVGIIYKFYEQIAKDPMFVSSGLMKNIVGKNKN